MKKKFWKWTNRTNENSSEERVLEFYGEIASESWFDDDITPEMFKDELFSGTGPVTIWISSPGGDCTAASRIYTMLMDYPCDVTVKIDGIAASAATVIAMAGTKVLMAPTAMMMIHNPATSAFGDHVDMEKAIDLLDEVKEGIITAYEIRTGLSHTQLSHMMDETTWMSAKKAVELGFADDILRDEKHEHEAESYSFASKVVEQALINRISAKARLQKPVAKTPVAKAEPPEKRGRDVSELTKELYKKLL